jgi:hypothetical protein
MYNIPGIYIRILGVCVVRLICNKFPVPLSHTYKLLLVESNDIPRRELKVYDDAMGVETPVAKETEKS